MNKYTLASEWDICNEYVDCFRSAKARNCVCPMWGNHTVDALLVYWNKNPIWFSATDVCINAYVQRSIKISIFFVFCSSFFFQYSQFQNVSYGLDLAQKLNKHIWYRKVYSWFMIEYARLMLPIKWIRIVFVCKNIYSFLLLSFVCINFQNIVIKYTIYCNLWICFFFFRGIKLLWF